MNFPEFSTLSNECWATRVCVTQLHLDEKTLRKKKQKKNKKTATRNANSILMKNDGAVKLRRKSVETARTQASNWQLSEQTRTVEITSYWRHTDVTLFCSWRHGAGCSLERRERCVKRFKTEGGVGKGGGGGSWLDAPVIRFALVTLREYVIRLTEKKAKDDCKKDKKLWKDRIWGHKRNLGRICTLTCTCTYNVMYIPVYYILCGKGISTKISMK